MNPYLPISIVFAVLLSATAAWASPPACRRTDAGQFQLSNAVVEAKILSSKRWKEGKSTEHLVATYEVTDVYKGSLVKGDKLIVTDTCLSGDRPSRPHNPDHYCSAGRGLSLTGVNSKDGSRTKDAAHKWQIYLRKGRRSGVSEQTWTEVSETGYMGGGCFMTPEKLSAEDRAQFDRMSK